MGKVRRLRSKLAGLMLSGYAEAALQILEALQRVLYAEFVRQASGDDSLSETEKTRILRCGWNVLNGKELAE